MKRWMVMVWIALLVHGGGNHPRGRGCCHALIIPKVSLGLHTGKAPPTMTTSPAFFPVATRTTIQRRRTRRMAAIPSDATDEAAVQPSSSPEKPSLQKQQQQQQQSPPPPPQQQQRPQVLATGYSQQMDLIEAIQEAMTMALQALPQTSTTDETNQIDLAIVSVSSLYDGNASPSIVVPTCLELAKGSKLYGRGIQYLIGSTVGGVVSSRTNWEDPYGSRVSIKDDEDENDDDDENDEEVDQKARRVCIPTELEGVPGVSITLAILPDVKLKVCGFAL
jgi:hypothetical protein